ncbi:MAG: 2-oxoacid:acceptor oxidoreductase family protein, partial [candidate division NC10 bacterium]|nr:2-oxoacid:acceptor oxidoreductase family protein [candidate division NC10 bacterium]
GVVTVNAILGYAALIEGKEILNLDQTGLAQKGGAVLASLILAKEKSALAANKVGMGKADLYLVLDLLGGANPVNLDRLHPDRTIAVVNTTLVPTGEMIRNVDLSFPDLTFLKGTINRFTRAGRNVFVDAGTLAEGLFADHMMTNIFTLGVAYQAGLIPLAAGSIEAALRLNGVQVEENIQAFRYGRLYAHTPARVEALVKPSLRGFAEERAEALARLPQKVHPAYEALLDRTRPLDQEARRMLAIRIAELIEYQDVRYAEQYVDFILRVADQESEAIPGRHDLTHAVICSLYKLMAYKDEYEVARLYLKKDWRERLLGMFDEPRWVIYHLHPPILRTMGLKRKIALGPWFNVFLRLLYWMRRLRGTRLDPFGSLVVRQEERRLIPWYREAVEAALASLDPTTYDLAVEVAKAPDRIRGYESIKTASVMGVKAQVATALDRLREARVGATREEAERQAIKGYERGERR